MLEVEVKARCGDLHDRLKKTAAKHTRTEIQEDLYFTHPSRDFKATDEALRLRKTGSRCLLTYKGPKMGSGVKTREEIEHETPAGIQDILLKLGFKKYRTVRKKREYFLAEGLEVCLDEVEGLGSFIEVESKNPADKDRILELLERLGVNKKDRTSKTYLELLEQP